MADSPKRALFNCGMVGGEVASAMWEAFVVFCAERGIVTDRDEGFRCIVLVVRWRIHDVTRLQGSCRYSVWGLPVDGMRRGSIARPGWGAIGAWRPY